MQMLHGCSGVGMGMGEGGGAFVSVESTGSTALNSSHSVQILLLLFFLHPCPSIRKH